MEWLLDIMVYLSNRTNFLWVYRRNKPTQNVERTQAKLANQEQEASDLQAIPTVILSTILNKSFHHRPSLLCKPAQTHVNLSLPNPDICQVKSENLQKDA